MKFWVSVENEKNPSANCMWDMVTGTLDDAINYAWEYMNPDFGIHVVTICDEEWHELYTETW